MKLKYISLLILILLMTFMLARPALALTSDPAAFDEVWSELYELDDSERASSYADWCDREESLVSFPAAQDTSAPIILAGDIDEHHLQLPATDVPWLINIEDFNLVASDPELVRIDIVNATSGEGSISVMAPDDFIDHGGSVTVDPYSLPPQVKINGGGAQPISALQLIIKIVAPIERIVTNASLPLNLMNFAGSRLDLKLQGNYQLDLSDIHLEQLKLEAMGSGSFILSGDVDYASIDLNGSMDFDSKDLRTTKLHARLDGPLVATFGEGEQSIFEVRGGTEVSPPSGEIIQLQG